MAIERSVKVTVLITPETYECLRTNAFNEHVTISTYVNNLIVDDSHNKEA